MSQLAPSEQVLQVLPQSIHYSSDPLSKNPAGQAQLSAKPNLEGLFDTLHVSQAVPFVQVVQPFKHEAH
jgi:hypothetical protein